MGGANNTTDVDFANPALISNPYDAGFAAPVPDVNGAPTNSGGNIYATATAGNITVSGTATAKADALFGATGNVVVNTATADLSLGILAGGNVSSSTSLIAGEDLAIKAGGIVGYRHRTSRGTISRSTRGWDP